MGQRGGRRAADALHHGHPGIGQLVLPGPAGELEDDLADLVEGRAADGMAPGLQPPHGGDGDGAIQGDLVLRGQTPALPGLREAGRLQEQAGHDAEGVVHLEEAHLFPVQPGPLEGQLGRAPGRLQVQGIRPVVQAETVRGHAGGQDVHRVLRVRPGLLSGGQDHRRGPVTDRGAVQQADGRVDHSGVEHVLPGDGLVLEEGVGVVPGVAVGVHREVDQGVFRRAVALEVEVHEPGVLADQGHAVGHLAAGVQGLGQGRGGDAVAHLLRAHGHGQVHLTAGHGQVGHPQGRRAAGCGRPHLHRLDPDQAGLVREEGRQVLLGLELIAEHVAGVEGVHPVHPGIGHGQAHHPGGQLPQAFLGSLLDGHLADPYDAHVAQTFGHDRGGKAGGVGARKGPVLALAPGFGPGSQGECCCGQDITKPEQVQTGPAFPASAGLCAPPGQGRSVAVSSGQ